jgi:hypothetical protein
MAARGRSSKGAFIFCDIFISWMQYEIHPVVLPSILETSTAPFMFTSSSVYIIMPGECYRIRQVTHRGVDGCIYIDFGVAGDHEYTIRLTEYIFQSQP